jgi:hypothetical protein
MTFLRDLKFKLRWLAPVMKKIAQAPGISTWSPRIDAKPGLGAFATELSESGQNVPRSPITGAGAARALCVTHSWKRA